jgi:hypothetical protein
MSARDDVEIEFAYRAPMGPLIIVALFFGAIALSFGALAAHNKRGLVINLIIRLSPDQAAVFYLGLAVLAAALAALALLGIAIALFVARSVVVSADGIVAPRGRLSLRYVAISLRAIVRMHVEEIRDVRYLSIEHTQGRLRIDEAMLVDGDFEELCATLADHVRGGRSGLRRAAAPDAELARPF